ncbi:DAK2 domain-containing protein [Pseudonocardia sp. McavD-2-B]|uniref:DAK2 domain-containing protein n=1 Tax=Pseudonocardia sp. McavD-2-B TaxID=2954499 RepID=UPI0020985B41|nr:DAK2 domain-containing protein [Pseudonocardia sp. McavD-2-B]MCO7193839.1 DAK2 domain-containing protein [Pseudonocardia sp. McavD-2-B]
MTGHHPLDQDAVLARFARAVEDGHGVLTDLDQHSGDGDYGDNLRAGVRLAVALAGRGPQRGFGALGEVFLDEVGGTSGPLLGLLFSEIARALSYGSADTAAFGSPASFTSPTGNISCRITGGAGDGAVRCDVTARTWSAGDCPDAALVTGGPTGARTECGGAPVGSGAAVLDYGTHLTEGDVTCVSSRTGVECRDARTGAGFTAARAAYRLY